MVIKPDPNKSIFNSNKNMAFFQQAENQSNDVIVITKDNKGNNYNTFNHFYKPKKKLNNKKEIKEEQEKDNNTNIRDKIDKDYENSFNSINKLISLDAKIKTDINKHIEHFDNYNKNTDYKDAKKDENNDINKNEIINTNLINILLTEVRALSNKQISLLDLMDEIQTNTQQQIENLNQKIVDLDTTVKNLNHQLFMLQKEQ